MQKNRNVTPRRRGLLRSIGLALAGLAVGSGVIEIALRLAEIEPFARVLPAAQASFYGPDPDTGYAHRPGARGMWLTENRAWVEINGLGLRDRADRKAKPGAQLARIGIFGDSVTEALQVRNDQTFAALVEQATGQPNGRLRPLEVVNLGLAGASPAVTVQRLRKLAPLLELDGAFVLLNAGDLLRPRPDETSEFVGYVPGPDSKAVLRHGFRDTRSFRFRTNAAGRALYWLLDNSRLALLLNNRKNAGLLAELAEPPRATAYRPRSCAREAMEAHEELWSGKMTGFAQERLTAVLKDLHQISGERHMAVELAVMGLPKCPEQEERLSGLREVIRSRIDPVRPGSEESRFRSHITERSLKDGMPPTAIRGRGLIFFDLEASAARHIPPGKSFADLTGWGSRVGTGHLNELGHRVYAAAIVDLLTGKR